MKLNEDEDNEMDLKQVELHFRSKLADESLKNVQTIRKMFADNTFTDRKLDGFKQLLKINPSLDNTLTYVLAFILSTNDPTDEFNCTNFYVHPILAERALSELSELGYLDCINDNDIKTRRWYSIKESAWNELVSNGTLTLSNKATSSSKVHNNMSKYLINKDDIQDVTLYYNDELNKSLAKIKTILEPGNLKNVQKRILEENQHAGICISFYGPSGTGKTEKVLQIAKESNRDVYNFKIADTESKYCGEKQNLINKLFDEFRKICNSYQKENKPEPILLLNEADALFARRHDESDENNTANRENNQLQAELLNHIENFDGIMIITTNQIQTFDDALERRFLFKIQFNNPDKATQKKIWKNRFPELEDHDLDSLTDKYDFTGGNIQNIKKKSSIDYIVNGKKSDINGLLELCKDEKIQKENSRKIGFGV